MKFFKPEDFDDIPINDTWDRSIVAARANAKLEREGKVVWFETTSQIFGPAHFAEICSATHKALLINIEPIRKCLHPTKSILPSYASFATGITYQCECGVSLKVKEFEEIK